MPPTRRSSSRLSQPKPNKEEEKPANLIDSGEGESDSDEKFYFSFAIDGLTAKECAEKMESLRSKEEFLSTIPPDEAGKFVSKAIVGMKRPIKCFDCERMYASASGLLVHLKKCEVGGDPVAISAKYRENPFLWLKVAKDEQESVLGHIVGTNLECFAAGCSEKFSEQKDLIAHLDKCLDQSSEYYSYKDRPTEFRQLDRKVRNRIIREVLKNGEVGCLACGKMYLHSYALGYHIDRCQVDESEQPWKCHRCGFKATVADSSSHLEECGQSHETKVMEKLDSMFTPTEEGTSEAAEGDDDHPIMAKRRRNGGARITQRKNGSTLYRYRKSTVTREFNGVVTVADQKKYERVSTAIHEEWKTISSSSPVCEELRKIPKSQWTLKKLQSSDPLHRKFTRQSVTMISNKVEGLQSSIPIGGVRVNARQSAEVGSATAAFCGAPINSIRVAPCIMSSGDEVICVCTFGNETNLESDSSIVQFWKHRVSQGRSLLEIWFLLHLPKRGTVLSMAWLQKHTTSEDGLIGFAAFSTTLGEVLIYRIDEDRMSSAPSDIKEIQVVDKPPDLVLALGKLEEIVPEEDVSILNATIKVEGEEIVAPPKIETSSVPITKISWSHYNGGRHLAGVDALGHILLWDLDSGESTCCARRIDHEWQSPPSDVAWIDEDHLVVAFRERVVRMINIHDWTVTMEENTMKTAGTRVHTDSRLVNSFFTFNSEYMSFPYPNATGVAYVGLDNEAAAMVIVPTGNTHQLMTWDVAVCPPLGTLFSCGIDGRLIASATGRLVPKGGTFFANRNLMSLRRRRILKDVPTFAELLKEVKQENSENSSVSKGDNMKGPLEESAVNHEDVCSKMWLEITFDEPFSPGRPELSCRDQRIESLNCVDASTNSKFPVSFTGGEAGLLFAVPSKLVVQELDL